MEHTPVFAGGKRYRTFDSFAREKFGRKMARIPLDAGFSCPNRDGRCGWGGCSFCANGSAAQLAQGSLADQYAAGCAAAARKWQDCGCIPYLQAGTNTYDDPDALRRLYRFCASLPGAEMLAIGTRADCLSPAVLDVLLETAKEIPLHVELGMQSCREETLRRIRRGYGHEAFLRGYDALRRAGGDIRIGLHLVNGLPGEMEDDMFASVREAARLHPEEIKLHTMCVLRGTALAEEYQAGQYQPLTMDETVSIVCRELTLIPEDIVIGRISADASAESLLAPLWVRDKRAFSNRVDHEMKLRNRRQGDDCQNERGGL